MPEVSINYDRAAEYFDETRRFPEQAVTNIALFIAQKALFTSEKHLLEVGIGTGRMAVPLAQYLNAITGVDVSHKMLTKLREKQNTATIHVAQADGEQMPFSSRSFDFALLSHVLHLVPEPEKVLSETARVLKRPGQLIHIKTFYDTHEKMQPLFDVWDQYRPVTKSGPHDWRQSETLLEVGGWFKLEAHRLTFQATSNPKRLLDAIKHRYWSNTWEMSDADIERAYHALEHVANEQFDGEYDVELVTTSGINVQIFVPTS